MPPSQPTAMPPGFEPPVPYDRCFDAQYGLELLEEPAGGESPVLRARIAVRPAVCDRSGALAGGVVAAAAEALASRGTALAVMPHGDVAQGLSNDTTVVADVTEGHVVATARVVARGAGEWVWTVETVDDAGSVCAVSRVTVAVRPARS